MDEAARSGLPARWRRALAALAGGCEPDAKGVDRSVEENLFRTTFDNVPVAIAIVDLDGALIEVNRRLAESAGRPIDAVRGMSIFDFAPPEDVPELRRLVSERVIERRGTLRTERRMVDADGHALWVAFSITHVRPADGEADFMVAVGEDVTDRHRLQQELHWQSRHDSLTGLPNRRSLLERIGAICADASTTDSLGLCFIDLDEFKQINDRYGHGVGDRVLRVIGTRLRDYCAAEDHFVARIGGDEFVVLMAPRVDRAGITVVADALLDVLAGPVLIERRTIRVSASIGVVVAGVWGVRSEVLLDAADRELYRAKKGGKDRWEVCVLDARALAIADRLADVDF